MAWPEAIHTVRWVNQLAGKGYDLHLFPSRNTAAHPQLNGVTVHFTGTGTRRLVRIGHFIQRFLGLERRSGLRTLSALWDRSFWLAQVIRTIKPDIVHSLMIPNAGYLVLAARDRLGGKFPAWVVTSWGSDIYLHGRLTEHVDKVKAVLKACDYFSCECQRDVQPTKNMGLRGEVLPLLPAAGGFDLTRVVQFRQPGLTSARRLILLKGYQHWAGRALVGLRAISLCARELRGYRVAIYLASPEVKIAAELVSQSTGIPIEIIPFGAHDDMLRLNGRARISIGLSISDGLPNSLLEAMVMGAYPIQSCTACADEWIVDGKTGLIVPPEDPEVVAAAIRWAVLDDDLVDGAAAENARVVAERLDYSVIRTQVIAMYEKVAAQHGSRRKRDF